MVVDVYNGQFSLQFTSSIFMSGRNFSMRVSMTALFVAVLDTRIHFVATWANKTIEQILDSYHKLL